MGLIDFKNPKNMIVSFVMLIIGVQILVAQLPTVINNIINISTISNLGFAEFFQANGVVLLLLGAGVLFAIFGLVGLKGGKGGF